MTTTERAWYDWLRGQRAPRVLEVGTRRTQPDRPGGHRAQVLEACPSALYTGCDAQAGADVDVVADAHALTDKFQLAAYDALLCVWTLEHLARPWEAVRQFGLVLCKGGRCLVGTHQSFPLHGFPQDYFRFSREAHAELFGWAGGWKVLETAYEHPARVVPLDNVFPHARDWSFAAAAWLNVWALAERV